MKESNTQGYQMHDAAEQIKGLTSNQVASYMPNLCPQLRYERFGYKPP